MLMCKCKNLTGYTIIRKLGYCAASFVFEISLKPATLIGQCLGSLVFKRKLAWWSVRPICRPALRNPEWLLKTLILWLLAAT